jgi:hypothetical protein
MRKDTAAAGFGALAFGILTFVALMIAAPPGGTYSTKDVDKYLAKGHRAAVFVAIYVLVVALIGMLLMLWRMREEIAGARSTIFWALSVASTASWLAGFAIVIAPAAALAFSGGHLDTLPPTLTYTVAEAGWAVAYGAGGILLGCALLTYAIGPVAAPAWVRWSTLVAGICAVASIAWFPQFLVFVWAIVIGIWTLVSKRSAAPVAAVATQS